MNNRMIAGLGMLLLAVGLMIVWYVDWRSPSIDVPEASVPTVDQAPVSMVIPALGEIETGPAEVDSFLTAYDARSQALGTDLARAQWTAATDVDDLHTSQTVAARRALDDFVGSRTVMSRLRLLRGRRDLTDIQDRRIEAAWRRAAHVPATNPEAVARTVATARALDDSLAHHTYWLHLPDGAPRQVAPIEIADTLAGSDDLATRRAAWESARSVGSVLRPDLVTLRDLRNRTASELGYSSFFDLEAADYGLDSAEILQLMTRLLDEVMPLYEQLHCWVKHTLAARYGVAPPRRLPAHWLTDPTGADWSGVVPAPGPQPAFAEVQPAWIVDKAGGFWASLGFQALPASFWEQSDLYPLTADATRRKLDGTLVLPVDREQDVRVLANLTADVDGFITAHRVLGRAYQHLAMARPQVPFGLREGADRALPLALDGFVALNVGQPVYLQQMGLLIAGETPELVGRLLHEALTSPVVQVPRACGTITHWEHDFYEDKLSPHLMNGRWWELAARWQGLAPPALREEIWCDPAALPSVIEAPARGYDQAIAGIIAHQLHRYVCRAILRQDVHAANAFGNPAVGEYLRSIMALGATRDGREVLRQATGEDISAEALLAYYAPLQAWLEAENAGRDVGF